MTGRIAGQIENDYLNHNFETQLSFLESELEAVSSLDSLDATETSNEDSKKDGEGPFVAGARLTAADFMMAFPLEAAQQIGGLTREKFPLLTDYIARVQSREAYKKAIDRIISETGKYEARI